MPIICTCIALYVYIYNRYHIYTIYTIYLQYIYNVYIYHTLCACLLHVCMHVRVYYVYYMHLRNILAVAICGLLLLLDFAAAAVDVRGRPSNKEREERSAMQ